MFGHFGLFLAPFGQTKTTQIWDHYAKFEPNQSQVILGKIGPGYGGGVMMFLAISHPFFCF